MLGRRTAYWWAGNLWRMNRSMCRILEEEQTDLSQGNLVSLSPTLWVVQHRTTGPAWTAPAEIMCQEQIKHSLANHKESLEPGRDL